MCVQREGNILENCHSLTFNDGQEYIRDLGHKAIRFSLANVDSPLFFCWKITIVYCLLLTIYSFYTWHIAARKI